MAVKLGYANLKTVNGNVMPDFSVEKTNNNTTLGKMINATVELLKRYNIKGIGGAVGNYDSDILGEACHKILSGGHNAEVYGLVITDQYFQTAKII